MRRTICLRSLCFLLSLSLLLGCSATREEEGAVEIPTEESTQKTVEEEPVVEEEVSKKEYAPEGSVLLSNWNSKTVTNGDILFGIKDKTYKGSEEVSKLYDSLTREMEFTIQETHTPLKRTVEYESFGVDFGLCLELDREAEKNIEVADRDTLRGYFREVIEETGFPVYLSLLSYTFQTKLGYSDLEDSQEAKEKLLKKLEKSSTEKELLKEIEYEKEEKEGAESLVKYTVLFLKRTLEMTEEEQAQIEESGEITKFLASIDEELYQKAVDFLTDKQMAQYDDEELRSLIPISIKKASIYRLEDNSLVTDGELEEFFLLKEEELRQDILEEALELDEVYQAREEVLAEK